MLAAMDLTRRGFVTAAVSALAQSTSIADPWYRRTYRWGQTNITEKDPEQYDIPWWREQWRRTSVQGVIINAGGIVAYYPSRFPLHHRAQFLGDRDLYGELVQAARAEGLAVLARMDSNRTAEDFYREHPGWFAVDSQGKPYRAADKYVTCVNSAYYDEYLPDIFREIIERSKPDGFADNSWSGLGRDSICYCANCARKFRDRTGKDLPRKPDWNDAAFRKWIEWNYDRRLEIWDANNRVTRAAGGPHCLWVGMNSGSIANQARTFRDFRGICARAEFMLLDHQSRNDSGAFQQNTDIGKLTQSALGEGKLAAESMAMYQAGRGYFRVSAKPAAEARMWMLAGIAGGIEPWWHHIGAKLEDRRAARTAEPVMLWHKQNEAWLVNRRPYATVGLAWSQRNTDFHGRDEAEDRTEAAYRGFALALSRARIPYVPVHLDDVEKAEFAVLILPDLGAMPDAQCDAVRMYVQHGGSLLATGQTSLFDAFGDPRGDYGLAELFRAHATAANRPGLQPEHTYLRIRTRGPALSGFEDTDILPFGGTLAPLRVEPGAEVPLTYIPPFPTYPPETAWMRTPSTEVPGLVLSPASGSRGAVAFLPAAIDSLFARNGLPDHAALLGNLVRWLAGGRIPLEAAGLGWIDCSLYCQPGRVILHLLNVSNAANRPLDELLPVGPFELRVKLPGDVRGDAVRLHVAGGRAPSKRSGEWLEFTVNSITDHEMAVIG